MSGRKGLGGVEGEGARFERAGKVSGTVSAAIESVKERKRRETSKADRKQTGTLPTRWQVRSY